MSLLNKLKSAGTIKAEVISKSIYFNDKDVIPTDIPIINVAFSARPDGGIVPGISILAGESKSFKTLLGLLCMKAYLDEDEDAIAIVYDSEFGITPEYLTNNGIDTNRVLHIPIEHIEQLKFDMLKRLESVERGDKVFFLVDSLGALASKKEVEDALEEKSVADMTRAKAIRSLLRIITPHFTMKNIPCFVINHTYKEMSLYPKTIVGGGTAVTYSANQIFIITKSQEKDGTELTGWNFTINIDKSRFVREKSKFTFTVLFGKGIAKYSGLFDLAMEIGFIKKATQSSYCVPSIDPAKTYRRKDIEFNADFWESVLADDKFKELVYNSYSLAVSNSEIFDNAESTEEDED